MEKLRKITALILAVLMIMAIPAFAFADDEEVIEEDPAPVSSGTVATLYILLSRANKKEPHTWLYLVNESEEPIVFGHYTVPAGGVVSCGNFHDRGSGAGIHYNLERYWVKPATYERTRYLKTSVTAGELRRASNAMKYMNHWDYVFCNCSFFATTIWNICSPRKILHLGFPQITNVEMILWGAKKLDFTISKVGSASNVYKYTKEGMEPVKYAVVLTNYGV